LRSLDGAPGKSGIVASRRAHPALRGARHRAALRAHLGLHADYDAAGLLHSFFSYVPTTLLTSVRIAATYRTSSLEGRLRRRSQTERGVASRAAVRIRAPGGSGPLADRKPHPGSEGCPRNGAAGNCGAATRSGPKTARVGAPRGPFRFAPNGRVSQTWCAPLRRARRLRIPPPGAPPAPSVGGGGREARGSWRAPVQQRAAGTKECEWYERRA
jgi:hypothetical protein